MITCPRFNYPDRIVIAGGAAIALRVPSRVTGDVDVVSEGMPAVVRRAAKRTRQEADGAGKEQYV
ncbi:MAG: hypothetical protein J4F50_01485 [Acidimicrobiia bacterium]|nr:hypothetical protein [Acidimicrobiia bacterium]